MTAPQQDRDLATFLQTGADGQSWKAVDDETFDSSAFYAWMTDCRRLLLSRDELTWIDRHTAPDGEVDTFINMSCGNQLVPHVTLDIVAVLRALGVSFAAGTGPQFCCGKPFLTHGMDTGHKVTGASIKRIRSWGAATAAHACQSCQIVYSSHIDNAADDLAGLASKHLTTFLEGRLRELGDRVPWQRELPMRVFVHGHEVSAVHKESLESIARTMAMIPGVDVVGSVEPPSRGSPCATEAPGAPSVLAELTDDERREVSAELEAQAAEVGATAIVPDAHFCQREWSKFASDRLAVTHYVSMVADALGCSHPDRYQAFWNLRDPEAVLDQTRPYWQSWGLDEQRARVVAYKHFHPHYTGFVNPKCACGGNPARCTTGLASTESAQKQPSPS